ncbi:helix-turn-helix domain-containing protein [Streptomyces sp. NPDC012623]|uniref:helix-turn-helix domain-containing protein n=1 Tax=unclassified Streptomyces TaxID=2593676 RepID=UPI0036949736
MDKQQFSAPPRALQVVRVSGSGVARVHEFQDPGYTIVGNHLAQHGELSFTAIGLGTHIQSLPVGSPVDIRTLAARFPEGRERIASALRELEAHGYIERRRERTAGGRIVSLTISYNNPEATRARLARLAREEPDAEAESGVRALRFVPVPRVPAAPAAPPAAVPPALVPLSPVTPAPAPPTPVTPAPVRDAPPPLPRPQAPAPGSERTRAAADLLAGLRRDDPRLLLSERDVRRLAPGVEAWLERGAAPDAVRRTLTADLPPDLRHPAALLAHRLTALLPPPLPVTPVAATTPRPVPLQNCDRCDRAYRAPEPGTCRGCTPATTAMATATAAAPDRRAAA